MDTRDSRDSTHSRDGRRLADAVRILAVDAVEKAKSGHPGMPMGMADIATVLWREFLRHNPQNPSWQDRDRFILSNGHGSMLHYALLHLSGYDLPMDDIINFRQMGSSAAGHPELETIGIETTTGPLGQGLANAVGMAIAEHNLALQFNHSEMNIISHYTYVFAGDGCMMEGISHEACSLAGHLQLGKLICFFDDNGISIDGQVTDWCSDDINKRFAAYNWNVIGPIDGHQHDQIRNAIREAHKAHKSGATNHKPNLIICKTHIGYGSPSKADTAAAHGASLGEAEVSLVRKRLGWQHSPFEIPDDVYQAWDMKKRGKELEDEWESLHARYQEKYPNEAEELRRRLAGELPSDFDKKMSQFVETQNGAQESLATRQSSKQALDFIAGHLPELIGGSADLSGSNCTKHKSVIPINYRHQSQPGNYIYYGVRELAMSAIMNGISLHGGYMVYGGTFLVFLDYSRSAVRLAAMMKQRVTFVFSHDSIGVGEDGPTHQPIEHLAILRHTPGINLWRPADGVETAVAWQNSIQDSSKSDVKTNAMIISRQKLQFQDRSAAIRIAVKNKNNNGNNKESLSDLISRGGYVLLSSGDEDIDLVVIATGSELDPARQAVEKLIAEGKSLQLVSMPCCELFDSQDEDYKNSVLPVPYDRRLAIEAAVPDYWKKYAKHAIGIDRFGISAPANKLFEYFGFTPDKIYKKINQLLAS